MEASGCHMGIKTLNALTFKLSVTQILAKVANDAFFFLFDDAIIPDMLREMFVVNDSIYEEKFDTEEDVSAKVAEFLESGTESDKQEKALAISKKIVETTDLAQNEREEILAKLDELVKRFEQTLVKGTTDDAMSDGTMIGDVAQILVSPIRLRKTAPVKKEPSPNYAAATTADFEVRQSTAHLGCSAPEPPSGALNDGGAENVDERIITLLSSSVPNFPSTTTTDKTWGVSSEVSSKTARSDGAAKTKKNKKRAPRKKKQSSTLELNPTKPEPKCNWVQNLRAKKPKTQGGTTRPNGKLKKALSNLSQVKNGLQFAKNVAEQMERRKLKEQNREKNINHFQVWLKQKTNKKKKKRVNFDLRLYLDKTKISEIHALNARRLRNPYVLEGVQWVPAERLGAWREEIASGRKKWSSAFHTAAYSAAHDRGQTYKLKNQATARRVVQPKLITFGEYGEVEWFTCLKSQDAHYGMHAEHMRRLQLARKIAGIKRNWSGLGKPQ